MSHILPIFNRLREGVIAHYAPSPLDPPLKMYVLSIKSRRDLHHCTNFRNRGMGMVRSLDQGGLSHTLGTAEIKTEKWSKVF